MTQEFIPYEQALELKELGFDEPCFGYFSYEELIIEGRYKNSDHGRSISSLLYQQAFRWFREKYDWPIETWIQPYLSTNPRTYEGLYWRRGETESVGIYDTYEEAELACLIKLIEIVKTKQQ
jgi:hypothetical protein